MNHPDDKIIKYTVYINSDKDSMYDAARSAGISDEEIQQYGLGFIGYEVKGEVVFNRTTGEVIETWSEY